MSDQQIRWALAELGCKSKRLAGYETFEQYYNGIQPLAFATDKYRTQFWTLFRGFSDNMCQSVVDVQAERLSVIGFTSSTADVDELTLGAADNDDPNEVADFPGVVVSVVNDPMGDHAWDEWEDNFMDLVADQVHSDAFLFGDGFVIADAYGVWRQSPYQMAVQYDPDRPGKIRLAAKMWSELPNADGKSVMRLNIYAADPDGHVTLTRYATAKEIEKGVDPEVADFADTGDGDEFDHMPVVHFANKRYGAYGQSELQVVIPLQNALNKASMDLIIAMEYQAFQQRYVTGVDVELDENGQPKQFLGKHGPGNYLAIADPDAKVGSFDAADLAPYVKVIGDLRAQIARVTGIPPHYFFSDGGATVSGEALKTGEIRFERKGNRQQRCFGKSWESLLFLVITSGPAVGADEAYGQGADDEDLNILWDDLSPRSPSEEMDVLLKKQAIGVPNSQLQKEAGYDPDQVLHFATEFAEQIKLGLVASPNPVQNPAIGSGAKIAVGESSASTASGNQLGVAPGATPPAE